VLKHLYEITAVVICSKAYHFYISK
jgi:hypothetical protein